MKIEVTKNVANHHTNPNYPTIRVRWDGSDSNFMIDDCGPNWCPRDNEAMDLVQRLVLFSPTFRERLKAFVRLL